MSSTALQKGSRNARAGSSMMNLGGGRLSRAHPSRDLEPGVSGCGVTVWFTGLSGAGKTTICESVHAELLSRNFRAEILDGDLVRKHLWPDLGFSRFDREENIRRIGLLAQLLTRNGVIVLVAAISPYRTARDEVRSKIAQFLEVYVDAPLHVCEKRDPKGLYSRARSGELRGFTGIDDPYEPPLAPEIRCASDTYPVSACREQVVSFVLKYLFERRQKSRGITSG